MSGPLIRLAGPQDVAAMLDIYTPVVRDTAISFEETPPSPADFAARVSAISERFPWLVCVVGCEVLGYAYGSTFSPRAAYQWAAETTVYVANGAKRRGVGRGLYTSLLACLALQGHTVAIGRIALPNAGSVGLHTAMGFEEFGLLPQAGYKLGSWHDVGYWRLPLTDQDRPNPLRTPPDMLTDPQWTDAVNSGASLLK